jgi:enolase
MLIKTLRARQVLDSRGNPTVECEIVTSCGTFRADVPSGASTGKFEALELRDGGKEFHGKGVRKACENVNTVIAKALVGKAFETQAELDRVLVGLDGTPNKSNLGANALLGVSLASARAFAAEREIPLYMFLGELAHVRQGALPTPMLNVINGGKHAGLENDCQEFMIVPTKIKRFSDGLRASVEVYHEIKRIVKKRFGARATAVGDEGGFVLPLSSLEERIEILLRGIENAGYGQSFELALDVAASEFYRAGSYTLAGKQYSSYELIEYYEELSKVYRIFSIEDGLAEEDWGGWQQMMARLGSSIQLVGDDLLVTNVARIKKAIELRACNALLLKVNQIGTLTEAIDAANMARNAGWRIVVSHRSGETEDAFIADLAAGIASEYCKFGAPARSERTAKYNQLLRIEEQLGGG